MCVDAANRNCTANVDCTRLGFTADNGKVPRVENMGLTVNREHYTINNLARNNRTCTRKISRLVAAVMTMTHAWIFRGAVDRLELHRRGHFSATPVGLIN